MGPILRLPYVESYLKNGAAKQEAGTPIFIGAHIQLAGYDLANNHTFKLLSGLLRQTLSKKTIASRWHPVNPKAPGETENGRAYQD